jgi:hypothetical protein
MEGRAIPYLKELCVIPLMMNLETLIIINLLSQFLIKVETQVLGCPNKLKNDACVTYMHVVSV